MPTINESLQALEARIARENNKRYWLIRTENGRNYDLFKDGTFISLSLYDCPSAYLSRIARDYNDFSERYAHVREKILEMQQNGEYDFGKTEASSISLLAKQICNMCFEIKRGDIVIIPSTGANCLSIGRVTDTIFDPTINENMAYSRRVDWIKEIRKSRLDPCLYKALGAHQAVCDITKYAEFIERNYNSFFVVENKFHYVLTVNSPNVSAYALTKTINSLLDVVQQYSNENDLGINVEDINFTINVNSPGKFSFVTSVKNAVVIMAVAVALFGGRVHYEDFDANTDGCFRTVVECVNQWLDGNKERDLKLQLLNRYINSLDIQSVEQLNEAVDDLLEEDEADLEDVDVNLPE